MLPSNLKASPINSSYFLPHPPTVQFADLLRCTLRVKSSSAGSPPLDKKRIRSVKPIWSSSLALRLPWKVKRGQPGFSFHLQLNLNFQTSAFALPDDDDDDDDHDHDDHDDLMDLILFLMIVTF